MITYRDVSSKTKCTTKPIDDETRDTYTCISVVSPHFRLKFVNHFFRNETFHTRTTGDGWVWARYFQNDFVFRKKIKTTCVKRKKTKLLVIIIMIYCVAFHGCFIKQQRFYFIYTSLFLTVAGKRQGRTISGVLKPNIYIYAYILSFNLHPKR